MIKGVSWRLFAGVDTLVVTTAVMFYRTGSLDMRSVLSLALGIVGMEMLTKTFLYAMHERLWERERVPATTTTNSAPMFHGDLIARYGEACD
jgi:uncharacterized membrane protein